MNYQRKQGMVSVEMLMIIGISAGILLSASRLWNQSVQPQANSMAKVVLGHEEELPLSENFFSRSANQDSVGNDVGKQSKRTKKDDLRIALSRFISDENGLERATNTLWNNRNEINRAAKANGIAPELLAAIIAIERANRGGGWDEFLDQIGITESIGVGQIKPSTLAMAEGKIPTVVAEISALEGSARRTALAQAKEQVERSYESLPEKVKSDIEKRLLSPVDNIRGAAAILNWLKNRPNRYPEHRWGDLSENQQAIIATEYNLGPTNSQQDQASASGYGKYAVSISQMDEILGLF